MKQFKWLIIVSFILLVISFYLTNKNFQESSTLKTAFEKQDRIEVLHYLMRSEKYASQYVKRVTSFHLMVLFV